MRLQPLSLQIWRAEASNCRWTDDCCKGESSSEESEEEEETSVDDWEVNVQPGRGDGRRGISHVGR